MASSRISFVSVIPTIQINGGVAFVDGHIGDESVRRAMSVATLAKFGERIQTALRQHAEGERAVIVD